MLTKDRSGLAARAVECFRKQIYQNKRLVILDTGVQSAGYFGDYDCVSHHWADLSLREWTIGALRNEVNKQSAYSEIIAHFDDDDWSHPSRISEQVALLQSSGSDCVGYRECLFWDERPERIDMNAQAGAWLYSVPSSSWVLGSSFCYWRRVWEQRPFSDLPRLKDGVPIPDSAGEDVMWRREVKCVGVSGLPMIGRTMICEPRMICRIHGSNTTNYDTMLANKYQNTWKRVPQWDARCREVMG
jgi:hypothetical protein